MTPALLDHPELLTALSSSATLALEVNAAETAVRRAIERDLHEGAQQRLIAMRMKLGLAEHLLDGDAVRAQDVLDELRGDVDATLRDVRSLARGTGPPALTERGLREALTGLAQETRLPMRVHAECGRYSSRIEIAVYFCCLEARQNVAKHAGRDATVGIELTDDGERLTFLVVDDGNGIEPAALIEGAGLGNIRGRAEELGGAATITGRPGGGTEVRGTVSLRPQPSAAPPPAWR